MSRGPSRFVFDAWSHVYDLEPVQASIYRPVHRAVITELSPFVGQRILDVGCGTGILAAALAEREGVAAVGCDFSFGMLVRAKGRRGPAWVQGDGQHLPLRSRSVDTVVAAESFHWFPDPDAALGEMARVLIPGGRLLAAMVNVRTDTFSRLVTETSRRFGQPWHWPTKSEIAKRMQRAGLHVVGQQRITRLFGLAFPTVLTVAVRP